MAYFAPILSLLPLFLVEGKRQAGSSHLNDKFSFEWDTTVVINKVINNSDHSVSKSRHRRILSIGRSRNCVKGYYFVKRYLIIREQIFQEIQFHLDVSAWTLLKQPRGICVYLGVPNFLHRFSSIFWIGQSF